MNVIRISQAEAVIEPFFDGGESYPEHEKFSPLSHYRVAAADGAVTEVKQSWCDVMLQIYSAKDDGVALTLERDCEIDAANYDTFLISGRTDNVAIRLMLRTELGEETVIEKTVPELLEISGGFHGNRLFGIRLELFLVNPDRPGNMTLQWFGLQDSSRMWQTEGSELRFSPKWEGCFAQEYEIAPSIGIWIGREELPTLREKVRRAPFDRMYQRLRETAEGWMNLEPEKMIEEYLVNDSPNYTRVGHKFRGMIEYLPILCVVGVIEEDREMIRLAGRLLLSVAVTPHWCESFMGNCPGVTWHHRSFLEGLAAKRCAIALDLIGSSLTWHGRNIVYDAMMQKGLPRVEADMFSVEYIRSTNQGIVFNDDRIFAYIALADRYPRYEKMLAIAEEDFHEMVERYIEEDGGSPEGPGYWMYSMDNIVETAHVLARYHKKPIGEYVSDRLKKAGNYALCMFCARPEGLRYLRINDCYSYGAMSPLISDFFYRVTGREVFGAMLREGLQEDGGLELLMIEDCPDISDAKLPEGLLALNVTGETSLHKTVIWEGEPSAENRADLDVLWHISAGKPYHSHFHEDKGQILLCVNGEELLCDRGNSSAIGKKPISHNLFVPESAGLPYSQPGDSEGGRVLSASYEDGVFSYKADLTGAWEDGLFTRISRELYSDVITEMVITDVAECVRDTRMSIRFHSVYPITAVGQRVFHVQGGCASLCITPLNYQPERYEICEDGKTVDGETVYQLVLYLKRDSCYEIKTGLEVFPKEAPAGMGEKESIRWTCV